MENRNALHMLIILCTSMMLFPYLLVKRLLYLFDPVIAVISKSLLTAMRADGVHCHWDSEPPKSAVCGAAS